MPGRRRATGQPGLGRAGGRTLSLLVAAPAIFTIAVITVSLVVAANRGSEPSGSAPASPVAAPSPPPDGWYTVKPVTGRPHQDCVAVLQDDRREPTLSQHRCDAENKLERIWLQSLAVRTYLVKVRMSATTFWCTTLDSLEEGARLHVRPCARNQMRQRFVLEPVPGEQLATAPVFRLSPVATRSQGMCVSIDTVSRTAPSTRHAVHTACARAVVRGYTFSPALAPVNG
ncbi:hypothetical protein SMC26_43465 [Actinomadura fulvescens]|uniref:Ricin B lectin domain-containing protein n=1 Tax=Actinomadura fulvescens TaxID=46160 RepID=A0ABP6BJI5_9ACTN